MSGLRKLSGQERLSQCSETSYTSRITDLITDTLGAIAIDSLKNLPAQLQILRWDQSKITDNFREQFTYQNPAAVVSRISAPFTVPKVIHR